MEPEKLIRDGKVAVLISPGFGAGWSTWAGDGLDRFALFDRRLVEAAEAGVDDIEPLIKKLTGKEYFYCGGWRDVVVKWLPQGTAFYVDEYDGNESIRTTEDLTYVA